MAGDGGGLHQVDGRWHAASTDLEAGAAAVADARQLFLASGATLSCPVPTHPTPGAGVVVDVRVDHDLDPLQVLQELLDAADAHVAGRAVDQLMGGDCRRAWR